jgi:hypothetical protein
MLFMETVALYCENHTEHTNSVRTSQEAHYVSATKINQLMLYRETVAVYCENHTEHTDTLCEQNADVLHIKARNTYSDKLNFKTRRANSVRRMNISNTSTDTQNCQQTFIYSFALSSCYQFVYLCVHVDHTCNRAARIGCLEATVRSFESFACPGQKPKNGFDPKTYWPTDCWSKSDSDSDWLQFQCLISVSPHVEVGKNTSAVIPASRKRRWKGNRISLRWDSASRPKRRLMRIYFWINLFTTYRITAN